MSTQMQTQSPAAASPSSASPDSPADARAGEFHAVEGGPEMRSGEQLLVEAYALIWLFLLAWLVIVWRKQNVIGSRLRDLEAAIARADVASASKQDRG